MRLVLVLLVSCAGCGVLVNVRVVVVVVGISCAGCVGCVAQLHSMLLTATGVLGICSF